LLGTIHEMGAGDVLAVQAKIEEYRQTENELKNTCQELCATNDQLQKDISVKRNEIIVLDEKMMLESFALYEPRFKFQASADYKAKLDVIRDKQKEMIKYGNAVTGNNSWTVNGSAAQGRKMVSDMIKLLLRSFNNECDYCVDNVKFSNIDANKKRIEKSFEAINKLGKICNIKIGFEYKQLKIDELHLAFEYQHQKEKEKEEAKQARAEQREQQKLEREIKEARKKIAKERKHFNAAIKELEAKLKKATDENGLCPIM